MTGLKSMKHAFVVILVVVVVVYIDDIGGEDNIIGDITSLFIYKIMK